MAVAGAVTVSRFPAVVDDQYQSLEPMGWAHGRVVVVGDATGGNSQATFRFPSDLIFKLLDWSVFVNGDNQAQIFNIEVRSTWMNAEAKWRRAYTSATGMTPGETPDIDEVLDRWPNQAAVAPAIPIADFAAVTADLNAVIISASVNANTIPVDYQVWALYWRRQAANRPGFMRAFRDA